MAETVKAIYEHGVLRPLQPLSLKDQQEVYLILCEENIESLVSSQREALTELAGIGASGQHDTSAAHDTYLYAKP